MNNILHVFFVLVLLLNPFIGALFICFFYAIDKNLKSYNFLAFIMSIMITLINLTKYPENDLEYHEGEYLAVKYFDYLSYLEFKIKEPFFYSFNYVCYNLTDGNTKVWLFIISFVSYFLFLLAIIKVLKASNATKSQIILGLISGIYFPQLFSLSAHLLRQFIAGALFVYFAADYIFCKNNKWWIAIVAFLIHSSSLIFFPLIFFKYLGDFKNNFKANTVILVGLVSYQIFAKLLLSVMGSVGVFGYALERASGDTTFDLGNFNVINYILMGYMVFVSIMIYKKSNFNRLEYKHFFSIIYVLSIFVLANINQSELSTRMFFYLFFFFPIILSLSLTKNNSAYNLLSVALSIGFIVFFVFRLDQGTWTYAPIKSLIKFTLFDYFSYTPRI